MFSIRRAQRPYPAEDVPVSAPGAGSGDDPLAELVRLVDADLNGPESARRRPMSPDELAAALAAELGTSVDAFDPIDPNTGAIKPGHRGYDPWDDAALDEISEEFNRIQEEVAPIAGAPGVLPPHSHDEEEAAPQRRSRLPLVLGGVAVTALVAGGIAGAMFLTGPSGFGDPVLVAAPTGPFKIVPEAGDTIPEPADNTIFTPDAAVPPKGEERLVTRPEEIPDLPGVTPQVNRVTLPDGQEIAPEPVAPADTGPRKVRTVLVKPDGTIIESPDGPVPSLPTPQASTETPLSAPQDQSGVGRLIAEEDPASSGGLPPLAPAEQTDPELPPPATAAGQPVAADQQPLAALPGDPADPMLPGVALDPAAPAATTAPVDAAAAPLLPPGEPAPTPRLRPAAPKPAADPLPGEGPLDLAAAASQANPAAGATRSAAPAEPVAAPAATAEPAAPAAAPAGSAFVQVSSQRSQEAALSAFASLQRKFPNILGGLAPDVQRADLGAKGVYYRVRVPQPTREEAAALCSSLKAAGADCLLAKK